MRGNLNITHESVLPPFYFVEFLSSRRWNLFGPGSNFVDLCLLFSLWVRSSLKFVLGRIKFRKVAFIRNLLDTCMNTSIVSWFSTWQYKRQRPPITKSNQRVSKDGAQSFISFHLFIWPLFLVRQNHDTVLLLNYEFVCVMWAVYPSKNNCDFPEITPLPFKI